MKIVCRSNCSGKTKELIKESLETGIPILALTSRKAASLKEKSMAYFGEVVDTIDCVDAKSYKGKVLIDDVEKVLDALVQTAFNNGDISVEGMTMSA